MDLSQQAQRVSQVFTLFLYLAPDGGGGEDCIYFYKALADLIITALYLYLHCERERETALAAA